MRVVTVVEPVVEIPKVSQGEGLEMRGLERAAILDSRNDVYGHAYILFGPAVAGDRASHGEFGKTGLSAFELIVVPGLSMLDGQRQQGIDSRALCDSVVG